MYLSTKNCVFLILIIFSLQYYTLLEVEAHSCGGCDKSKCNKTISCPGSVVKDNCGCCDACAKQVGEECQDSYHYNLKGKCDEGLFCYYSSGALDHNEWAAGVCRETNPDCKDVVCETDITEDCPYASSRYYHYMERGACCPRSSRCVCDEVCPKNIECPENLRPFLIKKGTGRLESCCDQYECKNKDFKCSSKLCVLWECPEDSIHDFEPDQGEACCPIPTDRMCACDPDNSTLCPDEDIICPLGTQHYLTHRRIAAKPGYCCNKKECLESKPEYLGCLVNDSIVAHGGVYYNLDSCSVHECEDGLLKTYQYHCQSKKCIDDFDMICCKRCKPTEFDSIKIPKSAVRCKHPKNALQKVDVGFSYTKKYNLNCEFCICTQEGKYNCSYNYCNTDHCTGDVGWQYESCNKKCANNDDYYVNDCGFCACKSERTPNGLEIIENTCPALKKCNLKCPRGFEYDQMGCRKCKCIRLRGKKCKDRTCDKQCAFGFKKVKSCQKCKCLECPGIRYCPKNCKFGNKRNDFDCLTCECETDRNEVPLYDNQVQAGSCVDKKGNKRQGGEKWTEGCRNCLCGGNKVYCEALKCPVPECDNPVSSNEKCCPYCPEAGAISLISEPISCLTNEGGVKQEGSTWSIDNGCTSCLCFRGKLMCTYRECPPLPCKITEIKKGDCCRTCSDLTPAINSKDLLRLGKSSRPRSNMYCHDNAKRRKEVNELWKEDNCMSCVCVYGYRRCFTEKCAVDLSCDEPVVLEGECCPRCLSEMQKNTCKISNKVPTTTRRKKSDDSGVVTLKIPNQVDLDCQNCTCVAGKPFCGKQICPDLTEVCKAEDGGRIVEDEESCCPICEFVPVTSSTNNTVVSIEDTQQTTTKTLNVVTHRAVFLSKEVKPAPLDTFDSNKLDFVKVKMQKEQDDEETTKSGPRLTIVVIILSLVVVAGILTTVFSIWLKRNHLKPKQKKEAPNPYPNIRAHMVGTSEPVSCL